MSRTVWHIEQRMRDLITHADAREAANEARTLLAELHGVPYLRPGATVDSILDLYHHLQERAKDTPPCT